MTEDIKLDKFIAKGAQGAVYTTNNNAIVIKTFNDQDIFRKELNTVKSLNGIPYMITCRGWSETKNWIFYENVPLNLENQILSDAFNDVDTKCDLLLNIATFIKNFHDKGWVHGDIVTMNVQLINNYTPRIIDFGWSGPITPEKSVNEDFKKFKRLIMQLLLNISYNEIVVMQVDLPEYSVKLGFNNLMNAKNLDQIVDEIKLLCQYYKSTDKWKIEKKNMMKKNGGTIRYNEIVEEEDE